VHTPNHSYALFRCLICASTHINSKHDEKSSPQYYVSEWSNSLATYFGFLYSCNRRLFVAVSVNKIEGSVRPWAESLKHLGESKMLTLLAETFAVWAHNLQVTFAQIVLCMNFNWPWSKQKPFAVLSRNHQIRWVFIATHANGSHSKARRCYSIAVNSQAKPFSKSCVLYSGWKTMTIPAAGTNCGQDLRLIQTAHLRRCAD
jgi:hypothetical protein